MKQTAFLFLLALLCSLPARAQGLTLLFESEPGTRPSLIFSDGFESGDTSLLDADGDGTPDLILTSEDADGNLQDLRVLTNVGTSADVYWEVQDVLETLGLVDWLDPGATGVTLRGFADVDADGTREAIVAGGELVVLIKPIDNSLAWAHPFSQPTSPVRSSVLLRAVTDLTGDGFSELIVFLPDTRRAQVWGKAN